MYLPISSKPSENEESERGASYQKPPPPSAFICAITSEMMSDPVVTCDGQTYERSAIERWLQDHQTSPRTNAWLDNKVLIPNVALRQQIDDFCKSNGYSPPRPYHPPPRAPRRENHHNNVNDPCPGVPGWLIASIFLSLWLFAWAAGEYTVAKEVFVALLDGNISLAWFFTLIWLVAWSFGGCIACSAVYGLCSRELFPEVLRASTHEERTVIVAEPLPVNQMPLPSYL